MLQTLVILYFPSLPQCVTGRRVDYILGRCSRVSILLLERSLCVRICSLQSQASICTQPALTYCKLASLIDPTQQDEYI